MQPAAGSLKANVSNVSVDVEGERERKWWWKEGRHHRPSSRVIENTREDTGEPRIRQGVDAMRTGDRRRHRRPLTGR